MTTRLLLKPYSVNGTGIRLLDYQRVGADAYEVTRWLTLFFIPLLPIGTLLIRPGTAEGNGTGVQYSFELLGKRPMRWGRVGRMYGLTMLAALPVAVCAWFEAPGQQTNMWVALFVFSLLWALAVLVFAQHGASKLYDGPEAQPMPTGNAGPRRAA
jgi:hypothetical protein